MGQVEMTSHFDRPPEEVWAFIEDIDNWPAWDAFTVEAFDVSDRPLRAGTTYRERDEKGELSDWTITEYDSPRHQKHVGQVPFLGEVTVLIDLTETPDGGTDMHHVVAYHVMPKARPIGWLLEKAYVDGFARKGLAATHADAERLLDHRGATPEA